MVQVFYVEDSGQRVFKQSWMCKACCTITHREDVGQGVKDDYPDWPEPTPESKICPTCQGPSHFVSVGAHTVWRRVDNGETFTDLREHPGACYNDPGGAWDRTHRVNRFGPDGRALVVICPNGHSWYLDSRASNCTMKHDTDHRCWVRHGSPEEGNLTVDKDGLTCGAGAGSIIAGDYHGFLTDSKFTNC